MVASRKASPTGTGGLVTSVKEGKETTAVGGKVRDQDQKQKEGNAANTAVVVVGK